MEELVIIGGGCAGMGAAIYAARAGLCPLVLEGTAPGGQIVTTSNVENFPGFDDGVAGFDLLLKMRKQAEKFGARMSGGAVVGAELLGEVKKLHLADKTVLEAKRVIVATGARPKLTGARGEAACYGGRGVSVCATCDGAFFRNKVVAVIGGGDSACEEASFLTRFASKVYLIHRRGVLRASKALADRVLSNSKVEPVWNSVLEEVLVGGNGFCRGILVKNTETAGIREIPLDGVFVAIGHAPNTAAFKGQLELDGDGYIVPKSGSMVETDIKNVYVAGDCADRTYRQAVTATAMGCMAAILASR